MRSFGAVRSIIAVVAVLACVYPRAVGAREPLRFEVSFAPSVSSAPFTGRVLVILGAPGSEPRLGPSWFNPKPFFAVDVKSALPDTPIVFDDHAIGFPGRLSDIAAGRYAVQAVIDLKPYSHSIGGNPGNGYSQSADYDIDPASGETIRLRIDRTVAPRPFPETDRVKLVDIVSRRLSTFHHREVHLRAGVVLPEGYDADSPRRYPTLYIVPGFGGDHYSALRMERHPPTGFDQAVRVVLDPDAPTGHHVFANSANNGPCGDALIHELIPAIEKRFRVIAAPGARFLGGHSSGGWSSLWLQVSYPDFFGGTWSTSPDPVDFRDFQQIDLYAPGQNMFTSSDGKPRPLARRGSEPVIFFKPFSDMETVMGHGGQLSSFEAVFSPRGADGQPKNLWDRATGAVDPKVARSWQAYDISLTLERNWATLGPKLAGKLHVFTGGLDTFYLDGAVRLLKNRLQTLGSDAEIEIIPGKDHGTIMTPELTEHIGAEMEATFKRNFPQQAGSRG